MKILHVPFHYYPDQVGGTEVYVSSLAQHLLERGLQVEIAAPGDTHQEYFHEGIKVHRFGVTKEPTDLAMLYGKGDPEATRQFISILDSTRPEMIHLHAMSPAVSTALLEEIKRRNIPVVFTCHIPGIICPRGTLVRNGKDACDAIWGLRKCTGCCLQAKGVPTVIGGMLSAVPVEMGALVAACRRPGRTATALRMKSLQKLRRERLVQFFLRVDRIVAVSEWLQQALIVNGAPSEKLTLCRHGTTQEANRAAVPALIPRDGSELRIAFLGRVDATKGLHVLMDAIRQRPLLPVKLDVYPIVQDSRQYVADMQGRALRDPRIEFRAPIPNHDVAARLQEYDAMAVPSLFMETGPLVVYDAFLAGIPVIGSDRGGIAELVTHERDGLLVAPGDVRAWGDALERLAGDRKLLKQLRDGVRQPRSMAVVAEEMLSLYAGLAA
jgi:glycosyltransferase involved in cell wall biosynthesis